MTSPEILKNISEWAKAPAPNLLWLDGEPMQCDDFDNPITMVAAKVISLAEQSQTPVISQFCELRRGQKLRFGNDSKEEQSLIGLVYSLIRQLVELLPPVFEASSDFSAEKFNSLDGTIQRWHTALSVLTNLTNSMPGPVFCIIDGLHWLKDRSTDNCLLEFVRVLRGGRLKVLLSTTGRSVVLRSEIPRSEILYISKKETLRRGVAIDKHDLSGRV
ncbi:phytanoyl- dioxygenase family protein [Colletotrichum graminicola]|nr:phytanoyl- dioxygenase family protein [Colletotrichum graminicola]